MYDMDLVATRSTDVLLYDVKNQVRGGGTVGQDPQIKTLGCFCLKDLKIAQKGPKPRKLDYYMVPIYRLIRN